MSRIIAGLVAGLAASVALPAAAATTIVLTFDDLRGEPAPMPAVYEGVAFQDFTYYDTPSDEYPARSGLTTLYSNYDRNRPGTGSTSIFTFGEPVRFDGAWFAGHLGVVFDLYRLGQRVHTSNGLTLDSTMRFLASGYGGPVDEVRLYGNSGNWVMDDLTYTTGVGAGVPEPASWALMILGFGAAGVLLRRRGPAHA